MKRAGKQPWRAEEWNREPRHTPGRKTGEKKTLAGGKKYPARLPPKHPDPPVGGRRSSSGSLRRGHRCRFRRSAAFGVAVAVVATRSARNETSRFTQAVTFLVSHPPWLTASKQKQQLISCTSDPFPWDSCDLSPHTTLIKAAFVLRSVGLALCPELLRVSEAAGYICIGMYRVCGNDMF